MENSHESILCLICNLPLTAVEINYCKYQSNIRNESNPTFEHPRCLTEEQKEILKSKTIEIPLILFAKLNAQRLLFEPNLDVLTSTNEEVADFAAQRLMVDMDHEAQCVFVKIVESVAASARMVLSRARIDLNKELKERDDKIYKESGEARKANEIKAPRTKEKYDPIKVQLSKEEKEIQKFERLGLTREAAEEAVSKGLAKKAEVSQ